MRKDQVSPEQWAQRMAYEREWKAAHKERHRQQQLQSQRRRMQDPATRSFYNEYRRRYRAEKRLRSDPNRQYKTAALLQRLEQLTIAQGNACAICKQLFDESKWATKPHSDHDHATKKLRGVLCFYCNTVEGKIRRTGLSPLEFGQRLHDYLANPPADRVS